MKIITRKARDITAGNIIDDCGNLCRVVRALTIISHHHSELREFLLMPIGCASQGVLRYSNWSSNSEIDQYVYTEVQP
jgi:hypothetical protein